MFSGSVARQYWHPNYFVVSRSQVFIIKKIKNKGCVCVCARCHSQYAARAQWGEGMEKKKEGQWVKDVLML